MNNTTRPQVLSSFQISILILTIGLLFILILGLSGLGIQQPSTGIALSPTIAPTVVVPPQ